MVDEIDKEMTTEELYALIDGLREDLRHVRTFFMAKELPPPIVLKRMGSFARWPEDHEAGKRLQAQIGRDAIPYKSECEGGAGLWLRLNTPTRAEAGAGEKEEG